MFHGDTYINNSCALWQVTPLISLYRSCQRVPFATTVCLHGEIVSLGKVLILLQVVKPRERLVVGQVNTSLGGLLATGPLLHRADDVGDGQPQVIAHEADPVAQRGIFEQQP